MYEERYMKWYKTPNFRIYDTILLTYVKNTDIIFIGTLCRILRSENVKALKQNGKLYFLKRDLELLTPTDSRPFSSDLESLKKRYIERLPIYESVCDKCIDNNGGILSVIEAIIGDKR